MIVPIGGPEAAAQRNGVATMRVVSNLTICLQRVNVTDVMFYRNIARHLLSVVLIFAGEKCSDKNDLASQAPYTQLSSR